MNETEGKLVAALRKQQQATVAHVAGEADRFKVALPKGFSPSPQQAAFLETVSGPSPSIVLEAVAGAGKTSTLIEALKVIEGTTALIVFNKKIAQEIEGKVKERLTAEQQRGVAVSTAHAAGFAAIRSAGKRVDVRETKCRDIAFNMARTQPSLEPLVKPAVALAGLAKQALLVPVKETQPTWAALARRHSLEDQIPQGRKMRELVVMAQRILIESNKLRGTVVDFDDMVYLPASFDDYPVATYDNVMIDEAQDTNAARRVLARKMLKPGGRLIAVGDRHQALYAFTGADSAALDLIAEEFDAIRLPLSVSFRCPAAVVAEARKHVAHIEPAQGAPEGVVRHVHVKPGKLTDLGLGAQDAVICRLNKPLVRFAFDLIREGIPCYIEGKDIGRTLTSVMRKAGVKLGASHAHIIEKMDAWLTQAREEAAKKDSEAMAQAAEDKHGAIMVFVDRCAEQHGGGCFTSEDVFALIEEMFADDVNGKLCLSTIHKAKGREWRRVFWLQAEPKRTKPMQDWEQETEVCCNYVAITRAMEELVFLHGAQ